MDVSSIATLVGTSKLDRNGITSFLRENIKNNPSAIEALAAQISRTSTHSHERNNRLSSLRMLMRNVCDELEIPKHTVVQRGAIYRVERTSATIRSTPDPLKPSIFRPLRQAAEKATPTEKEMMLAVVMEILGVTRRP